MTYRTPDERFEGLPGWTYAPNYLDQDGLRMHWIDEGAGDPVLLLHGEPTWGFLYRKLIAPLSAVARVVAPDYFGFGRSDKPVDPGWYSYDSHYASIERFVQQLDLTRLTIVVHDWSGPIGLRFAVEHPERVDRLVILNTGIGAGRAPSEEWLRFRAVVRELGGALDIGRLVEAGTSQGLSDEVREAYDAPFPTPESKAGALAFPELVPTDPDHQNTAPMNRVRHTLREWRKPALVVWGADDRVLPVGIAHAMAELIPGARGPVLIEGASHFVQEDKPDEVAAAIREFLET